MKSSHIKRLLLIIGAFTIAGCSLFDGGVFEIKTDKVTREYVDSHRRITITEIPDLTDGKILGKKLPNPYSMDVMSEAWEILHPRTREDPDTTDHDLEATHIYVRMLPEDASDVDWLLESDYEFFNYPLDYEILGDPDEYHDPSLPDSTVTWLYTVMPIDATLPSMDYEIVDVCYIPDDGPQNNNPNGLTPIEQVAFGLVGGSELNDVGDIDWEEPEPGDGTHPGGGTGGNGNLLQGNIEYCDNYLNNTVGVKGVKVTLRKGVKSRSTYTDENGHYEIPNVFASSPTLSVTYCNSEGFSCHYGFLLKTIRYKKTVGTSLSWSIDTLSDRKNWALANINNAAYDWYKYCETTGIQKPADDLWIEAWEAFGGASAIMMKHGMSYYVSANQVLAFLSGCSVIDLPAVPVINKARFILQLLLPDITICDVDSLSSNLIYDLITHELSHASHFQRLGSINASRCAWWRDVFDFEFASCIATLGDNPYGDSLDYGSGPCGVAEMWAHAVDNYFYSIRYPGSINTAYWFKNKALEHLFSNGISPKNAFDVLTPDVVDVNTFKSRLQQTFPSYSTMIDTTFSSPNF